MVENGRDGVKKSMQPCFLNDSARGVFERKVFTKERKNYIHWSKLTAMQHFQYLMDTFVTAFRNLIIYRVSQKKVPTFDNS